MAAMNSSIHEQSWSENNGGRTTAACNCSGVLRDVKRMLDADEKKMDSLKSALDQLKQSHVESEGECVEVSFPSIAKRLSSGNILDPFTPESDQLEISPGASPEMLHHTVWRSFHSLLGWTIIYYQFSVHHEYIILSLGGWKNVLFEGKEDELLDHSVLRSLLNAIWLWSRFLFSRAMSQLFMPRMSVCLCITVAYRMLAGEQ